MTPETMEPTATESRSQLGGGAKPGVRRTLAALALSAAVHGSIAAAPRVAWTMPSMDLDIAQPAQVEFGFLEVAATPLPPPGGESSSSEGSRNTATNGAGNAVAKDATATKDAAANLAPNAAARAEAAGAAAELPARSGGRAPENAPQPAPGDKRQADASAVPTALPEGAMLALRFSMARLRDSSFAIEVGALLQALPDWNAVLRGTRVDPYQSLDTMLIASANLSREAAVVAGRLAANAPSLADLVPGGAWRREQGMAVKPWPGGDGTPRVVADAGRRRFVLARRRDLAVGLAALERRRNGKSLLAAADSELFSFEVEGARRYVRSRTDIVPLRFVLAVRALTSGNRSGDAGDAGADSGDVAVQVRGVFASPAEAKRAASYWRGRIDGLRRNVWVGLLGLGQGLGSVKFRADAEVLSASGTLSEAELKALLGWAQSLLAG